jgi:hypothetical protein
MEMILRELIVPPKAGLEVESALLCLQLLMSVTATKEKNFEMRTFGHCWKITPALVLVSLII